MRALVLVVAVGCSAPSVELAIDAAPPIDWIEVGGTLDDDTILPVHALPLDPEDPAVLLLLPDRFVDHTLALEVSGLASGRTVARWRDTIEVGTGRTTIEVTLAPECGDGIAIEPCDDGNDVPNDGCSACAIDPGFACSGEPSTCIPLADACGDGTVQSPELCDDANDLFGDGCHLCMEEPDWLCFGDPSRCVPITDAALVDPDGPACPFGVGAGTRVDPFCSIEQALQFRSTGMLILAEGIIDGANIDGAFNVVLVGDRNAVIASSRAPAVRIKGGARVRLENVRIAGAQGAGGGIKLETATSYLELDRVIVGPSNAIGLEVKDGMLSVSRSRIVGNAGGGVKLEGTGKHVIMNTVVAQNGAGTGEIGGVLVMGTSTASALIHVTIADNRAKSDRTGGVRCGRAIAIRNSIVWNNAGGDPTGVDPTCTPDHSLLSAPWMNTEAGNLFADPAFIDEDYHVDPDGACIDAGDLGAAPALDIDGDPRPIGAGVDIGADEAG